MRSIETAVQALLEAVNLPRVATLVYIEALSLRWISPETKTRTWAGNSYTPKSFTVAGLSENLDGNIPTATLTIGSLDGTEQARIWADTLRGRTVAVTVITAASFGLSTGAVYPTTTWRIDRPQATGKDVVCNLAVAAAASTRVPSVTTQESHCQHVYRPFARANSIPTLCSYVGPLATCTRTYDGALGCAAHHPDLDSSGTPWGASSTGERIVQAKPYGGQLSGLTDRVVV